MGAAAARPDVAVGVLAGRLQAERVPRCVGVARSGCPRVLERSVRAAQTEEAASTKHQPHRRDECRIALTRPVKTDSPAVPARVWVAVCVQGLSREVEEVTLVRLD